MRSKQPSLLQTLAGHRRVGLVLSAGYFGFFGHAGLLAALDVAGLRPCALSGSSAGALVGAFAAAGMPPDRIGQLLLELRRQDFWDPVGLRDVLWRRDLPATGLLRGERFFALLRDRLPVRSFEQCITPLQVEVANLSSGESEVLHSGDLARAVWASCAYPGLFLPVRLGHQFYWDGGLVNKAPVACLLDRGEVDALLIHWLPSSELQVPLARGLGLRGHLPTMARGFAMARRENSRLQARLALANGVPVYALRPDLPRVGPTRLGLGRQAMEQAQQQAAAALAAPAADAALDRRARTLQ